MPDFENFQSLANLSVKLWRGERMCLIGMDVPQPEDDLVGFSIEVKNPSASDYMPLRNRLNFDYGDAGSPGVNGFRNYPSLIAPFQKFRWLHFPYDLVDGTYNYRVTKQHMMADGSLKAGDQIALGISLDAACYDDYLDIGFTRSFASSQAYADKYGNNSKVIPARADQGPSFQKLPGDVYQWLGFEAYDLIFGILNEIMGDPTLSLDMFAYDLDEPDIAAALVAMGARLRIIIDDSGSHKPPTSAESQITAKLAASAGAANVHRMHFKSLQHNKVLIVKRNGVPERVLFGSTNFSFRGIYIQANNALLFHSPDAAALYGKAFDLAFTGGLAGFDADPLRSQWHLVQPRGKPPVHFCFSPHADSGLSLNPVGGAIDQATSSVFYAIAFLNQTSGPVRDAVDRLTAKPVFSYGIVNDANGLSVKKPDGSVGTVDFNYLASKAPEPFKSEWSGGAGIHEHNKFVVTDFNLPTAKVFTGSSNLSPSGETGNGDNLVMIEDQKVATAYAIDAVRIFDHLEFRAAMKAADAPTSLTLAKPTAISGKPAWFQRYFVDGSQMEKDRLLFSR